MSLGSGFSARTPGAPQPLQRTTSTPNTTKKPTLERSNTAPPTLTLPSSKPGLRPQIPTSKKELTVQLKRENITAQVNKVHDLQAKIESNVQLGNHSDNKALYQQLAQLKPPFLDPGQIGKQISDLKQPSTSPKMFGDRTLGKLLKQEGGVPDKTDTLWENVKSSFIGKEDLSMMIALEMRHSKVSTLMQEVGEKMGLPVVLPGQTPPDGAHLRVKICGSSELSSDIDVNITAVKTTAGKDTEFVTKFNTAYRQNAPRQESGNSLDVNLYTKGVFPDFELEGQQGRFQWTDRRANKLNNKNQDIAALIKVRKFAGPQWNQFKNKLIRETPVESRAQIISQLKTTDSFVKGSESLIEETIQNLKTSDPKRAKYKAMNPKELALVANNRLYEKYSQQADKWQAKFDKSGDQSDLANGRFALSKAHYFANEAALSEGVLRRVVVNEQAIPGMNKGARSLQPVLESKEAELIEVQQKAKTIEQSLPQLVLSLESIEVGSTEHQSTLEAIETLQQLEKLPAQIALIKTELAKPLVDLIEINTSDALQSFNENFGDILKEIEHISHDTQVQPEDKLDQSLIKSSKYLGRMCRDIEALVQSLPPQTQIEMNHNPKMKAVLGLVNKFGIAEGYSGDPKENLLMIRKNKPGQESVSQIMLRAGLSYDTAQEYESAVVDLSVEVNLLFRPHIQM